jgi:hypothetical protein
LRTEARVELAAHELHFPAEDFLRAVAAHGEKVQLDRARPSGRNGGERLIEPPPLLEERLVHAVDELAFVDLAFAVGIASFAVPAALEEGAAVARAVGPAPRAIAGDLALLEVALVDLAARRFQPPAAIEEAVGELALVAPAVGADEAAAALVDAVLEAAFVVGAVVPLEAPAAVRPSVPQRAVVVTAVGGGQIGQAVGGTG